MEWVDFFNKANAQWIRTSIWVEWNPLIRVNYGEITALSPINLPVIVRTALLLHLFEHELNAQPPKSLSFIIDYLSLSFTSIDALCLAHRSCAIQIQLQCNNTKMKSGRKCNLFPVCTHSHCRSIADASVIFSMAECESEWNATEQQESNENRIPITRVNTSCRKRSRKRFYVGKHIHT